MGAATDASPPRDAPGCSPCQREAFFIPGGKLGGHASGRAWGWLLSCCERSNVAAEQRGRARRSPVPPTPPPRMAGVPPHLPLDDEVIRTRSALNEALGKLQKCCQLGHKQEFWRGQMWVCVLGLPRSSCCPWG
uniref:Uncharacterized protein n=1 Tax=Rousettus aegyptiacus TaxID=9407 RepID=A0A7J8CHT1_ROUAE|nr:hypothetical protein HJG63_008957 [Rousettus aegyptiacus]